MHRALLVTWHGWLGDRCRIHWGLDVCIHCALLRTQVRKMGLVRDRTSLRTESGTFYATMWHSRHHK